MHVNCYDERLLPNMFDHFAESGSYEQLKNDLDLNSGVWRAEADMLIDLLRSRLTFSKFVLPSESDKLAYAHLAFSPIQHLWIAARSALKMHPAGYCVMG